MQKALTKQQNEHKIYTKRRIKRTTQKTCRNIKKERKNKQIKRKNKSNPDCDSYTPFNVIKLVERYGQYRDEG